MKTQKNVEPPPPESLPEILDKNQAASFLGLTKRQIDDFTRAGKLPFLRLSQQAYRYRKSDLLALFHN
jgi:hypothetical protein